MTGTQQPATVQVTTLRAGEVAAAAGINPETLRYYERRGLLPRPDRTLGGHRTYSPGTVTSLRIIKVAQRLGFTLSEVAELVDTAAHRHGARDLGLKSRASGKLAEIERKIADLQVIRDSLQLAIDCGCDDLEVCADSPDCPLPFSGVTDVAGTPDADGTRRGSR